MCLQAAGGGYRRVLPRGRKWRFRGHKPPQQPGKAAIAVARHDVGSTPRRGCLLSAAGPGSECPRTRPGAGGGVVAEPVRGLLYVCVLAHTDAAADDLLRVRPTTTPDCRPLDVPGVPRGRTVRGTPQPAAVSQCNRRRRLPGDRGGPAGGGASGDFPSAEYCAGGARTTAFLSAPQSRSPKVGFLIVAGEPAGIISCYR
jgi:hypothetical protein